MALGGVTAYVNQIEIVIESNILSVNVTRVSVQFLHMRIMRTHMRNQPFFAHLCGLYLHMSPFFNAYS